MSIPTIKHSEFVNDQPSFVRQHIICNRPVKITDVPSSCNVTRGEWTLEKLKHKYGNKIIRLAPLQESGWDKWIESSKEWNEKSDEIILAVASSRVEKPLNTLLDEPDKWYIDGAYALQHCNFLKDDLPAAIPCGGLTLRNIDLWLGGRTKSRLHFDNVDNIFYQLLGSKRILLIPPSSSSQIGYQGNIRKAYYQYSEENDTYARHRLSEERVNNYVPTDVNQLWEDAVTNEGNETNEARAILVMVEAGQILYIPAGWWHQVVADVNEDGLCASFTSFYHPFWCRLKSRPSHTVEEPKVIDAHDHRLEDNQKELAPLQLNPRYTLDPDTECVIDQEEETDDPENNRQNMVLEAADRVLDDWFVTGILREAARHFIKKKLGDLACDEVSRVRSWFLLQINKKCWQHGLSAKERTICSENIPLRSIPIWDKKDFPWFTELAAQHSAIKEELLTLRGKKHFQAYRDPAKEGEKSADDGIGVEATSSGNWKVAYLVLRHKKFPLLDECPRTKEAIYNIFPRQYCHAFFSALTPGSNIKPHVGPSNRMLRVWLPVVGFGPETGLSVGGQVVHPKDGEPLAWDHSYRHYAWNHSQDIRVVLIVDIWHPDLTDPEIKFLSTLQNARLRVAKMSLDEINDNDGNDYFSIIERARTQLSDDDWWILKAEAEAVMIIR